MNIFFIFILFSTLGITLFHSLKEFGVLKTAILGLFPVVAYYFYPIILISILVYMYKLNRKKEN